MKRALCCLSGEYDSSFAAKKLQDFLWKDGKPFNYELDNIPRTQDLEPLYEETSGFYIYNSSVITSLNRRIGEKPYIVEVNEIEAVDIDEKRTSKLQMQFTTVFIKLRNNYERNFKNFQR